MPGTPGEKGESGHVGSLVSIIHQSLSLTQSHSLSVLYTTFKAFCTEFWLLLVEPEIAGCISVNGVKLFFKKHSYWKGVKLLLTWAIKSIQAITRTILSFWAYHCFFLFFFYKSWVLQHWIATAWPQIAPHLLWKIGYSYKARAWHNGIIVWLLSLADTGLQLMDPLPMRYLFQHWCRFQPSDRFILWALKTKLDAAGYNERDKQSSWSETRHFQTNEVLLT